MCAAHRCYVDTYYGEKKGINTQNGRKSAPKRTFLDRPQPIFQRRALTPASACKRLCRIHCFRVRLPVRIPKPATLEQPTRSPGPPQPPQPRADRIVRHDFSISGPLHLPLSPASKAPIPSQGRQPAPRLVCSLGRPDEEEPPGEPRLKKAKNLPRFLCIFFYYHYYFHTHISQRNTFRSVRRKRGGK